MATRGHGAAENAHIFAPEGSLDAWYQAKVSAATAQVPVVLLGDSVMQGYNASSWSKTSWEALVRIALQNRFGDAGRYFGVSDSVKLTATMPAGDRAWTLPAGGWTNFNMLGFQGYNLGTTGDTATFVPPTNLPYTFTDFDLKVSQAPDGSTATITVDGGGQSAPSYFNASYLRHVTFQYTGFAAASHTVVVTQTQSAKVAYLAGLVAYPKGRGGAGLLWIKEALQGSSATIAVPQYPTIQTAYLGSKASVEDWNPKLVIIGLGINDCQGAVGLDQYAYNLGQLCQSAQTAGASIVLVGSYGHSAFTNYTAYGQYLAAMRDLAHAYNAAFVNAHSAYGAAAGITFTAGHPDDVGHAIIAQLLLSIL